MGFLIQRQARTQFLVGALSLFLASHGLAGSVDFNRDIRPILSDNCFHCHGPDANKRKADLRLDLPEGMEDGIIAAGKPEESELVARIFHEDPDEMMPPKDSNRTLTEAQKNLLRAWIAEGGAYAQHWAFVAPQRPGLPEVSSPKWCRNPIDRFILARLDAEKLKPSPRAAPHILTRRLHLDLTGLPPHLPSSFAKAMEDKSSNFNLRRQVEDLLASEHYGERMALPWLDAARYADSNGFQQDGDRHQWPWRDWVVRAFNDNMPFDQFTIEQLAGDLLENPSDGQRIATAFNRNHMLNGEGGAIKEEQQVNYVVDRVDTTATTWLGLTMACAQCHDHKFDPVTQREFYGFYAFFNNIPETGGVDRRSRGGCDEGNMRSVQYSRPWLELPTPAQVAVRGESTAEVRRLEKAITAEKDSIDAAVSEWEDAIPVKQKREWRGTLPSRVSLALRTLRKNRRTADTKLIRDYFLREGPHEDDQWRTLARDLQKAEMRKKENEDAIIAVMIMEELPTDKARKTHVLDRGDYQQPGEEVQPGTPAFLPPLDNGAPPNRLSLARWLVSPDHPLTARVTVNRIWQEFFGTGLVKTAEDFGVQGARPSHPELLDWLAVEFIESGWDIKHMVRLILTSSTYLQSSVTTPALQSRDPENLLLARGPRYRLPAMFLRDQALAVSGLLRDKVGGPPVYPHQPEGLWADFSFDKITYPHPEDAAHLHRRSLYTFWRRTVAPPNMFDASARQVCTVKSARTNTPLHALTLLNDATFVEAARALAARMLREGGESPKNRINYGFRLAANRAPDARELEILAESLKRATREHGQSQENAYTQIAQIIFNLDEVLTKE